MLNTPTPHHYWLVGFIIALLAFLLFRQLSPKSPRSIQNLFAQLPKNQIDEIEPFYQKMLSLFGADRAFQEKAGGLKGEWLRFRTSDIYLQLVWETYRKGQIDSADAAFVWTWAAVQSICTVVAAPERCVCFVFWPLPHIFSFCSFHAHRQIVLRCEVAFSSANAPECLLRVRDLL